MSKDDGDITMHELAASEREEALRLLNDPFVAGSSIRFARKAIGLRRDQLAKKFGFTLSEMEDVESGDIQLSKDKIVSLIAMVKNESAKTPLSKSDMGLVDVDNHATSPRGADLLQRAGLKVET